MKYTLGPTVVTIMRWSYNEVMKYTIAVRPTRNSHSNKVVLLMRLHLETYLTWSL